jgi:hypothetical protein
LPQRSLGDCSAAESMRGDSTGRSMSKFRQGMLLGAVLCLAGVVAALWLTRDPIPPLTDAALADARRKWNENGPADYDMTLQMSGDQDGQYEVTVRGGEVTELRRGNHPIPKRGEAWRYCSVPGLFLLIDMELADAKQEQSNPENKSARQVRRAAQFDDVDGRPTRFRGITYGDVHRQIEWRILKFEPVASVSPEKNNKK